MNLIERIAFTDSVHGASVASLDRDTYSSLVKKSINFVVSDKPAGEFLSNYDKNYE